MNVRRPAGNVAIDSQSVPASPLLVAVVDGELWAAVQLDGRATIAEDDDATGGGGEERVPGIKRNCGRSEPIAGSGSSAAAGATGQA